jgi:carboxypeptidase PM20D1
VIPARATATLDCRLLPGEDEDALLDKLRRAVDDDRVKIEVVVRTLHRDAPGGVPTRSPLFDALEAAVEKHDPGAVTVPCLLPGATDSRFFRARGAVCHGLAPVVLNDEEYRLLHAANERVPAARLEKAMAIMYDWVRIFSEDRP